MERSGGREARHDPEHRQAALNRWQTRLNRVQGNPEYSDEWYAEQCGRCEFWVPLAGTWGLDFGACTNPASPFDGTVRFEHDGCEFFSEAPEWGVPEDFTST